MRPGAGRFRADGSYAEAERLGDAVETVESEIDRQRRDPGARAKPILKPPLATKWPGRPGQGPTMGRGSPRADAPRPSARRPARGQEPWDGGAGPGDHVVERGIGGVGGVEAALGGRADRHPAGAVGDHVQPVHRPAAISPGSAANTAACPLTPPPSRPSAADRAPRPSQPVAWTPPRFRPVACNLAAPRP